MGRAGGAGSVAVMMRVIVQAVIHRRMRAFGMHFDKESHRPFADSLPSAVSLVRCLAAAARLDVGRGRSRCSRPKRASERTHLRGLRCKKMNVAGMSCLVGAPDGRSHPPGAAAPGPDDDASASGAAVLQAVWHAAAPLTWWQFQLVRDLCLGRWTSGMAKHRAAAHPSLAPSALFLCFASLSLDTPRATDARLYSFRFFSRCTRRALEHSATTHGPAHPWSMVYPSVPVALVPHSPPATAVRQS